MTRPPALERGTEVRSRRAALKRRVEAGTLDLSQILHGTGSESDEEVALEMRITDLLRAVPGVGVETARVVCLQSGVDPDARLCTLTIRRRTMLTENMAELGVLRPPL
jgi:hypothetical protein